MTDPYVPSQFAMDRDANGDVRTITTDEGASHHVGPVMRQKGLLQAELLAVIAGLGHGQTLVIADAGLPIELASRRIDLAVSPGLPAFLAVLEVVLAAGVFEAATLASELSTGDAGFARDIGEQLGALAIDYVPHEEFKGLAAAAVAVVRTGEFTPYANIILHAGVPF